MNSDVKDPFAIVKKIGDLSGSGVCVYDLEDRRIVYANEKLGKIFGIPSEAILHNPEPVLNKINSDDLPFLNRRFEYLLQSKVAQDVEFCVKDGSRISFMAIDAYFIEDNLIVCSVRDISKRKENEQYIIDFGARKDSLLEMLTHNLSSPLTLTRRVLHSLEKAFETKRYGEIAAHIRFVEDATDHCINIINDLLKEEHFVSERIMVKQARFDVVDKMRLIVEKFKQSYSGNQLTFVSDVPSLFVTSDDVKFMQIVNNLISNALKFTPPNCLVEVGLEVQESSFTLFVKDDGIGIPDHLQPLIFYKYTPAGRTGLQGEKSVGVGLSIVKTLVALMKGTITFESKENKGATFYVTFPREPDQPGNPG